MKFRHCYFPCTAALMLSFLLLFLPQSSQAQSPSHALEIIIDVSPELKSTFKSKGRLFLFLTQNPHLEPRRATWPQAGNYMFAKNFSNWQADQVLEITASSDWSQTSTWALNAIPEGAYYIQVLWDQDQMESRITAPGNLFSKKQKISLTESQKISFTLTEEIPPHSLVEHELLKEVNFKSDALSKWWDKPMYVKAAILLPRNYQMGKAYPIRYNVAGYGGRYTRANGLVRSKSFMDWWNSEAAPELINVFLDGEGPFGDSYQMDSENSGPYGHCFIHELIPHIEAQYRGSSSADTRFVDGCSTGGWVSLGLQLYYPDHFNGVFSYSPDAIEFEHYQLINIYKDENAYVNEFGYLRPVMRGTDGEPQVSLKDFIQYENVQGASNTYLNSGGQFSAHTALYSPKGENGLPKPLFDPVSGVIDRSVAEHWKKYDFKLYAKQNWATLGPKLQGKIYIWMGDMDHFYLNLGTRAFEEFLKNTQNPVSDAEVVFTPMAGHCQQYSHRAVLEQIAERLNQIELAKAEDE